MSEAPISEVDAPSGTSGAMPGAAGPQGSADPAGAGSAAGPETPLPPGEPRRLPPEEGAGPLRQVVGLFVVPLLVVVLSVAIFVGFGWIAYEGQNVSEYLNDLRSGWTHRRWQAAYELSKILAADPAALAAEPGAVAELRRMFAETDDERVRRYLALVLGRVGDREAVPLLIDAAAAGGDAETRIYALWSLGAIGDPAAAPPLVAALADDDPGVRKTAAFALGQITGASAEPALERALNDPVADVRWNAALALAKTGSAAGVPVLEQMLDRQLMAQVPGITPQQQEEAMLSAIPALAALRGSDARALLERLREGDPSLRVRQAAIEALRVAG